LDKGNKLVLVLLTVEVLEYFTRWQLLTILTMAIFYHERLLIISLISWHRLTSHELSIKLSVVQTRFFAG
jgi:hypothetical protein